VSAIGKDGEEVLRGTELFSGLDDDEIAALLLVGQMRTYTKGATIFAEGSQADKLYVIYEGAVRISKIVEGIGEEALAILQPGDFFGEMALIDHGPRSAHAFAHHDVRLLEIPIGAMLELLDNDKSLATKFLWSFCRVLTSRLRETSSKISNLFLLSSQFR